MTTTTRSAHRTSTLVGAGLGLVVFLAVALLPAITYGGFAGLLLAGGIFGTPVSATFGAKALIVLGMVLGVTAVASLFAVVGAVAGAAVSALTRTHAKAEAKPVEHKP